ncbi:unnamed protein product [Periconia digitata]|uniref:2EXR domain-containing protein n=1 Tax=Periconia digitata TaxID=1303443 RepID=A0A9W4UEK6_9PLEO|nr:unnamed protein product [Periconia digitata]
MKRSQYSPSLTTILAVMDTLNKTPEQDSQFRYFPMLAAELRNQIWELSLPVTTNPGLSPYKPGCWIASGTAVPGLAIEFAHDRLRPILFQLPMAHVNHEARSIALTFARQQGLKLYRHGERGPIYTRHFDPKKDAMFIGEDQLVTVLVDFDNRLSEPDLIRRTVETVSFVEKIAIPKSCIQSMLPKMPAVMELFYYTRTLLTVVGSTPPDHANLTQWEFFGVPGAICRWSHTWRRFEWSSDDGRLDCVISRWEIPVGALEEFSSNNTGVLEIRPVRAVRNTV